jgi:hypothetical protein
MLIPILAVAIPIGQFVPSVYAWRMRNRVYRWYARLKDLELQADDEIPDDLDAIDGMLERLGKLEAQVRRTPMPRAFNESLFSFRGHVETLRARLEKRRQVLVSAGGKKWTTG